MRVYSAGEAIGPAWEHTKALLWRDRKWGRLLKLSLVAFGAELGSGSSLRVGNFGTHANADKTVAAITAAILVFVAVLSVIFFVVFLYLGSRLQLAQFDILVLRDPYVAPAWGRHGRHTWRWAGLKVAITLGTLLVLSPLLIPAVPIFLAFFRAMQPATTPDGMPHWDIHWPAMLALFGEVLAFAFVAFVLVRFVTSLVLPGVAMEDLRFGAALRRGWDVFRSDVRGMLLFALVQPLFQFAIGIAMTIGMVIALAVLALPFLLVGALLWAALHQGGAAAWVVLGVFGVVAAFVVLAAWLLLYLCVAGTLLMFMRAWSLYFLGGRYAPLGQYLEPGPAVPVWTPPPSLPRDDDNDGPDFPADPAMA